MTTNREIEGFFSGTTAKRAARTVIPVGEDNGAPVNNMYLFKYTNPRTGVTGEGANEGAPYMSFQAEVVKPDNFAGKRLRVFMGIFRKGDDENVMYNVQQMGGEDVIDGLDDDASKAFEQLAARLDGEEFIGRVGLGFNKKEQRDEVRIYDYLPADQWLAMQEDAPTW